MADERVVGGMLQDPNAMFGNDPIADAMLEQYRYVKMPNMRLHESEISALIAYMSQHPAP